MLTLLFGRDWTANRAEILRRISEDVRARKGKRILIVPELISHETERRLADAAGDTASRFAEVLSFTRLGQRLLDRMGNSGQGCLEGSGRIVAMAAAARQLHSKLKAYAAVETKPEFLMQMLQIVDEFKTNCISAQQLKTLAQSDDLALGHGALVEKMEELALLLEAYDAVCSQGKRDPRDQINLVLEQLDDIDFASEYVFYVDGFQDFTRQNLSFLENFIKNSPNVTVSLTCDSVSSRDMTFDMARRTAQTLMGIAKAADVECQTEFIEGRRHPLQTMCGGLLGGPLRCDPVLRNHVQTIQAGSVYQECQAAAQRVMELVQSGSRYRDIGLVCTTAEDYLPVLRLVFGQCRIPLYMSGTEDVLQSGVIATVIFALEAALGGFEQRDVLRYLRSTLSPLEQEECDRVENYAAIWGISGKRWTQDWENHPRGLEERWTDADQSELELVNICRRRAIDPLQRMREAFHGAAQLGQQVEALAAFLEEINFAGRLERLADAMDAEGDNRSAQILNQLWEILLNALEQLHDVLAETVWEEENFVRLLKLLLSQCSVGTIPPVLDAVSVGTVSAMHCQQQKHLILLGANEGSLPGYGSSGGVFSEKERHLLKHLGLSLSSGAAEGLEIEFSEIYSVFCGAEESVTVVTSAAQPAFIFNRLAAMSGSIQPADTALTAQLRRKPAAASYLVQRRSPEGARLLGIDSDYQSMLARKSHHLGLISPENVKKLYGKRLYLSASQVDTQAECRLAYFLKYGIAARERKEAKVDPAEFGTYVHAVLEQTAREVVEKGGFHSVPLEDTLEIARRCSEEYIGQRFSQLESERLEYLFRRNLQELEMVVRELWRELHESAYIPEQFELRFGSEGEMPAVDIGADVMDACLQGYVDRVDVWRRGESSYFRVVDYKTGKKDFDYCDVFNGVGLQMLLYLFALEQYGQEIIPGKRVSAGVQYFPARAKYLTTDGAVDEDEARKLRRGEWKRQGLLLADEDSLRAMDSSEKMDILSCTVKKDGTISGDAASRQQLGMLKRYLEKWLREMVRDIAQGNVTPNPYTRGSSHDACTFCPYGAVCHKETVEGRRNYKTMNAQKFWEEVEKEVGAHG